jgi:hypothetical protein
MAIVHEQEGTDQEEDNGCGPSLAFDQQEKQSGEEHTYRYVEQ